MGPLLSARIFLDFILGGGEMILAKDNINVSTFNFSMFACDTHIYDVYLSQRHSQHAFLESTKSLNH